MAAFNYAFSVLTKPDSLENFPYSVALAET